MTSADVGFGAASRVLVGVRLGLVLALAEALGDAAELGDDTGTLGETGTATAGVPLVLRSALGWLTLVEQPASTAKQSGTAPSRSESWVPQRYPTGGGYGR